MRRNLQYSGRMEYDVIYSARKTISAEIKNGRVLVRAPRHMTDAQIRAFLARHARWLTAHMAKAEAQMRTADAHPPLTPEELDALKARARAYIPARAAYYAPLIGVSYGKISIRCQRTRWGSCSSRGDLSFNCLLMLAPDEVIDSVIVHELCHIRVADHSPRFYEEVMRVFPQYRACSKWLKENGQGLMTRAHGVK